MKILVSIAIIAALAAMVMSLSGCPNDSPFCKRFDQLYEPITKTAYTFLDPLAKAVPPPEWAPHYADLKRDLGESAKDVKAACADPNVTPLEIALMVAKGSALIGDVWALYGSLQPAVATKAIEPWRAEAEKAADLKADADKAAGLR